MRRCGCAGRREWCGWVISHWMGDGSKYQANASRHKAMSYGRMEEAEGRLEAEVQELLERAAAVDEAEDAEYGAAVRGDELPEELRRQEGRLTQIKEAKARLEEQGHLIIHVGQGDKG